MKAIGESVFEMLTADKSDGSFYDRVSGRVTPEFGHQGNDTPYCIYDLLATNTSRKSFGSADMVHECTYEISTFSRVEDGAADLAEISDLAVGLVNGTEDASATGFQRIVYDVLQGTTIERADDMLMATIVVRAKGIQTSGT